MSTTVIYEKIQKLKLEMILDGWDIEEKYSNDGWKGHPGYTIWNKLRKEKSKNRLKYNYGMEKDENSIFRENRCTEQ